MARALLAKKRGTQPRGNTSYGKDYEKTMEHGIPGLTRESNGNPQRTLTGSGGNAWYDDGNAATGVADYVGNVWEWQGGNRLVDGEIQIIPDNNAAADTANLQAAPCTTSHGHTAACPGQEWRSIYSGGELMIPGPANTYKYTWGPVNNAGSDEWHLVCGDTVGASETERSQMFGSLKAGVGAVNNIPWLLKALGFFPDGVLADYAAPGSTGGRGRTYGRNVGERLPVRGGYWTSASTAGLFALGMDHARSAVGSTVGSRLAFVKL
jgi:hypothetical protein